jgi:RimJ/RimL family protein N-acetyltransferase
MILQVQQDRMSHIEVIINNQFAGNGRVSVGSLRHSHVGSMGLSLLPQYRDEGIGSILIKSLIDEAKKLNLRLLELSCFENNPRALHVYEKVGFKRSGVIPGALSYKGTYIGEVMLYKPL